MLFRHSKPRDESGQIDSSKPRITVAGILDNGYLKIGLARCSKNDQFSRKLGRDIALDRAMKNPCRTLSVEGVENINMDLFLPIAESLIKRAQSVEFLKRLNYALSSKIVKLETV